jgi:phage tail tape-measure protein
LLGLAVAGDVIDVATAPPGQRVKRAISDGVGLAGAIAGGEVGAEIGASAGSFFGPVGTVVGGLVGGFAGGIAGSGLASKAVRWATSLF